MPVIVMQTADLVKAWQQVALAGGTSPVAPGGAGKLRSGRLRLQRPALLAASSPAAPWVIFDQVADAFGFAQMPGSAHGNWR